MTKRKKIDNFRIGKYEFRYSSYNKSYEIVEWYPNAYYGRQDDFELVDDEKYRSKTHPSFYVIGANTFTTKENCFVILFFDKSKDGYDIDFVGSRPMDVFNYGIDEYNKFLECVAYASKNLQINGNLTWLNNMKF